ncbi:MAG: cupredoxin domain-containing protein [Lactobacillus equicursoris]|uniref:cupredoxin domain-containing protein n=1 Tax=Lactobacillus equicursoris TaxID=420645 RepID=UPI00242D5F34|nr:cupredoxin domain-containing protein [Lactobacillus equicursoris]MDD6406698.1 cupredoxin domain-containing protein [Lactobacillus equicursoris]
MLIKILVVAIALALTALICWWFFGNFDQKQAHAEIINGQQEGRVVVKGGYEPEVLYLKQGVPAKITFDMEDQTACLSHVVFPDLGVDQDLTLAKESKIVIPTDKKGEIDYACRMNMFHGKVIVQ